MDNFKSQIQAAGLTFKIVPMRKRKDAWNQFACHYSITISKDHNSFSFDYSRGTGHYTKGNINKAALSSPLDIWNIEKALKGAKFLAGSESESQYKDFIFKLAATNLPTESDILCSLLMDASGSDQSFENWCSDYGYESDSISAHKTWCAVNETRHFLQSVFGRETLDSLYELANDM